MTTIRIRKETHVLLQDLATTSGKNMQIILEQALEEYRRKLFLEQTNQAFANLKQNPKEWKHELQERSLWDIAHDERNNE